MTDDAVSYDDEDEGELVEWFDEPGLHVSHGAAIGVITGALALGALGAVGVLALLGRLRD